MHYKESLGTRFYVFFAYLVIAMFSIACIYPILHTLALSFSSKTAVNAGLVNIIPVDFSLEAYRFVVEGGAFFTAFGVSVKRTILGVALSMILTVLTGYPLSKTKSKFSFRNVYMWFFVFTMLFSGGMVANYLMITKYLHLKDNILVYILPALVSPWNMMLLRNFFATIPESLAESAKIDGANDMTILMKIVLPIAKPGLVTIGLFYALGYWNEWFKAMLYIDKENLITLQYLIMKILRNINFANTVAGSVGVSMNVPTYTSRMATLVVTIGPIVFLYPFLQKYFVKGLTVGGVKG